MFPSRYFNPRYWAKRYWSKAPSTAPGTVPLTLLTRSRSTTFITPNFSPTPDCVNAFEGRIELDFATLGLLNDSSTAVLGQLYPIARFEGIIDSTGLSFEGLLTDEIAFNGIRTDIIGFQGILCNC